MNSGYMPWSAIGSAAQPKSADSSPEEVKSKIPIVATTDIQGISCFRLLVVSSLVSLATRFASKFHISGERINRT